MIKLLKQRVEFLQGKIDALVNYNFVNKESIENISDKAHDALKIIIVY